VPHLRRLRACSGRPGKSERGLMIRERFTRVRAELVTIDDKVYRAVCDFEGRENIEVETRQAVGAVTDALRKLISLLLRVIDSLP